LVGKGELSISTVFPTLFLMGFLRIHVIFYTLNGFSFIAANPNESEIKSDHQNG